VENAYKGVHTSADLNSTATVYTTHKLRIGLIEVEADHVKKQLLCREQCHQQKVWWYYDGLLYATC